MTDSGRVTFWWDGERITADSSVFWEAVHLVDDPIGNLEEFRDVLAELESR